MKWLIAGTAVCGGALLFLRLSNWRDYRDMPGLLIWILFFCSYGVSSILNVSYGALENIEAMVWMGLQLFVLFPVCCSKEKKDQQGVLNRFCMVIVLYTAVQAALGLAMLLVGYSGINSDRGVFIGLQLGRLWGSYSDPNYGAILSCVSILCSIWLIRQSRRCNKFLFAIIALQYLYIIFSYSRSGQVCLAVAAAATLICFWPQIRGGIKKKVFLAVLIALLVGPACGWIRNGYNHLHLTVYAAEMQAEGLYREEELTEDITNGRLSIWKDGLDVWKKNPLFGVSYRNISPYMKEHFPDSYMVTRENALNTFHNMFVDVAVSQGAVGLLFVMAAVGVLIKRLIHLFAGWKKEGFVMNAIPALVVITIGTGALFVSDILYVNTPTSVAFWFFFGRWLQSERDF